MFTRIKDYIIAIGAVLLSIAWGTIRILSLKNKRKAEEIESLKEVRRQDKERITFNVEQREEAKDVNDMTALEEKREKNRKKRKENEKNEKNDCNDYTDITI